MSRDDSAGEAATCNDRTCLPTRLKTSLPSDSPPTFEILRLNLVNGPGQRVVLAGDGQKDWGCHCRKLNPTSKWSRIG